MAEKLRFNVCVCLGQALRYDLAIISKLKLSVNKNDNQAAVRVSNIIKLRKGRWGCQFATIALLDASNFKCLVMRVKILTPPPVIRRSRSNDANFTLNPANSQRITFYQCRQFYNLVMPMNIELKVKHVCVRYLINEYFIAIERGTFLQYSKVPTLW